MTEKLRFGPGGIPRPVKGKGIEKAVEWCAEHGLGCMEMEFVHSVWLKQDKAPALKTLAKEHDVHLTAHGSYYINLNSKDEEKREASMQRILQAAERTAQAGGKTVTFHPAYYHGQDEEEVYQTTKEWMQKIMDALDGDVTISPETTGKGSQFGTVEELCRLAKELDGNVGICVDFAHLHARSNGEYNTKEEFEEVLDTIKRHLGEQALKNMHIHMSGIEYGPKGEKNHLPLEESSLDWQTVLQVLHDYDVAGYVISESPIIEEDAMRMKEYYETL